MDVSWIKLQLKLKQVVHLINLFLSVLIFSFIIEELQNETKLIKLDNSKKKFKSIETEKL